METESTLKAKRLDRQSEQLVAGLNRRVKADLRLRRVEKARRGRVNLQFRGLQGDGKSRVLRERRKVVRGRNRVVRAGPRFFKRVERRGIHPFRLRRKLDVRTLRNREQIPGNARVERRYSGELHTADARKIPRDKADVQRKRASGRLFERNAQRVVLVGRATRFNFAFVVLARARKT